MRLRLDIVEQRCNEKLVSYEPLLERPRNIFLHLWKMTAFVIDTVVLIVGLFSLLTNGILLFILIKDPLRCFNASSSLFIISLTCADLLSSLFASLVAINILTQQQLMSQDFESKLILIPWITSPVSFLT